MRTLLLALVIASCVACPDEPLPENEDGCTGDWFVQYLRDAQPPAGDLGCVASAGLDTTPIAESCHATGTLAGQTVDHQSSDPVGDISVQVYFHGDVGGAADVTLSSDVGGALAGEVPLCQPLAYRSARGAGSDAWVTLGQHKVIEPGSPASYDFRSVANGTVNLIGLFLGISMKADTGIVFGKAVGCADGPPLDRVQILLRDADCRLAAFEAGYTTNELPDAFLAHTSEDGFFFAVNVPPGSWTLEGYVAAGDSFRLVSSTPVEVEADRVSLADLQVGRGDGLVIPEGCRACP